MLKSSLVADIVVVTKEPPTFNTLRFLKQSFDESIPNSTTEVGMDTMDMTVRDAAGYSVHLLFTWFGTWTSNYRAEEANPLEATPMTPSTPAEESATTATPMMETASLSSPSPSAPPATVHVPQDINYTASQKALLMIHQVMWFSQNSVSPNVRQCIKIMKDLHHRHPAFAVLNDWALEVIVVNALRALPLSASISQSLRAIFAFVASGMLLPGVDLLDPCTRNNAKEKLGPPALGETASVLQDLSQENRLAITKAAQKILNDIAFGRWEVIIG